MRIITLSAEQLAVMPAALATHIKAKMMDRANAQLEDREASAKAVDAAVALRRILADLDDTVPACLVGGTGTFFFPGLKQIDDVLVELFGADGEPAILREALNAHAASLAVGAAAAVWIGDHVRDVLSAATNLLNELGEGSAVDVEAQVADLRLAVSECTGTTDPARFTQEAMDDAVAGMKKLMPAMAAWIAAAQAHRPAVEVVAPYGERPDGSPKPLEECE